VKDVIDYEVRPGIGTRH